MSNKAKRIILIVAGVLAAVVILSLPAVFLPDNGVANAISTVPLFIVWLLYYLSVAVDAILWIVCVLNVFVGGYTQKGWIWLVVALIVATAFLFLFTWILTTTGFAPFSDEPFKPVWD